MSKPQPNPATETAKTAAEIADEIFKGERKRTGGSVYEQAIREANNQR